MTIQIDQVQVIDTDTHLTEPHDLWTGQAPASMIGRMPHVADVEGTAQWVIDDQILGRAGGAAFCQEPAVLRVRLFGPQQSRIAQAARIESVDAATARQRLPEVDRARAQYVRRLYGSDIDDPDLYHLQIDSTVLPLDTCVDIIATAYRSHVAARADHAEALADQPAREDHAEA